MLSLEQTRLQTTTGPRPPGNTRIRCLNLFAKQGPRQPLFFIYLFIFLLTTVLVSFTVGAAIAVPERLHVFHMAVKCEWAQVGSVVWEWCGASSRTGPVYRDTFFFFFSFFFYTLARHSWARINTQPPWSSCLTCQATQRVGGRHLCEEGRGGGTDLWATGVDDNEISHVSRIGGRRRHRVW